jgi:hypothetical protein
VSDIRTLIRTDVAVLRNARAIIALAASNAREVPFHRNLSGSFLIDAGIAVEHIDAALDALDEAIATLEAHMPDGRDEEPDQSRDTFVPHPTRPEMCDACNHELELNADFRCARCGAA